MKAYNVIEIKNKEIITQMTNRCDEVMGYSPFSKADFKRAIDEVLIDKFGKNYISKSIDINTNEVVSEVCNWLADFE